MPWTDHDGPIPRRSEDELLSLVHRKAEALGELRRRQVGVGLTIFVVFVAGMVAAWGRNGAEPVTALRTASGRATPSSARPLTSAPTTAPAAAAAIPPPLPLPPPPPAGPASTSVTSAPATTAPAPEPGPTTSTSTATLVCRNSYDRACGPLVWDPPPGPNRPLTVSVSFSPQAPKVGEKVVFHVVVEDDAPISHGCRPVEQFGDDVLSGTCMPSACPPKYGPWTPAAKPDHWETTFEHAYSTAGTYTAKFGFLSLPCGVDEPYASTGEGTATVVVSP